MSLTITKRTETTTKRKEKEIIHYRFLCASNRVIALKRACIQPHHNRLVRIESGIGWLHSRSNRSPRVNWHIGGAGCVLHLCAPHKRLRHCVRCRGTLFCRCCCRCCWCYCWLWLRCLCGACGRSSDGLCCASQSLRRHRSSSSSSRALSIRRCALRSRCLPLTGRCIGAAMASCTSVNGVSVVRMTRRVSTVPLSRPSVCSVTRDRSAGVENCARGRKTRRENNKNTQSDAREREGNKKTATSLLAAQNKQKIPRAGSR